MTLVSTTVRYKLFVSEFTNICDKLLRYTINKTKRKERM